MSGVDPGDQKYADGDSIPYTLGSSSALAGDAVTISSSSGDLILSDGSNGFIGILGTQTAAGNNENAANVTSGSEVVLQLQGVVRANVAASVVAGNKLVTTSSSGELGTVDSDGSGSADPAGPGDMAALTDADADGYALVRLP